MTDYTPTTEEVRKIYADYRDDIREGDPSESYPLSGHEFDRWLAEVKATEREACVNHVKFLYCSHSMEYKPYQEAVDDILEVLTGKEDGSEVFEKWLAEVKAQVWDDCAQEAYDRGMLHDINFEDIKALNPYRQGEEQ